MGRKKKWNAYVKSILGSTKSLEPKLAAKAATEGCWLKRITVISGDKPSHDRIARLCLNPAEPVNGAGAAKIAIFGWYLISSLLKVDNL